MKDKVYNILKSLRVPGHPCPQCAGTFPKPFSSLMDPNCATLLSSPQTDPLKECVWGRCWCLNPLIPEECRTGCTCGSHTGLLVFPSSQLVVFLPLNLRFRKFRLEWRGCCCALAKPELCMLLSSLQRVEFFIVACHNLLWSLSVFSSIHHP